MRLFLGMCVLLTLPLWASTQVTQIHDIDHGDHITDEALVFLASGKIAKINVNDTALYQQLTTALQRRDWVEVDMDDNREILAVKKVPDVLPKVAPKMSEEKSILGPDPLIGYHPSVASEALAKQLFREQRHAAKEETQCFNRAHIWTYEWRVKHNFYAKKIWIMFTRKFIRRYNFEWWFHVSPMINVAIGGQIKERTMDKKYSSGPLPLDKWAKIFLRGSGAKCPYVKRYVDHSAYPETGWCFFQKSPMYYYQPVDLEFLDKYGTVRSSWSETDVRTAYAEAFEVYP